MTTVGIRELRQNAGAVLRKVVAGETVEVTDHGPPIARIVPLHTKRTLDQLVAEGRATEAQGDLLAIEPIPAAKGERRSRMCSWICVPMSGDVGGREAAHARNLKPRRCGASCGAGPVAFHRASCEWSPREPSSALAYRGSAHRQGGISLP